MRRTAPAFTLHLVTAAIVVVIGALGCTTPAAPGEGEGSRAAEGEGTAAEGEGATSGEGEGAASEGEGEGTAAAVTWYRDVLPVARAKCEVCHTTGGIGPFDMEDESAILSEGPAMAADVVTKYMPPWMPSSTCGHTYVGDRSLTDNEINTFVAWSQNSFALGDIADANGAVPSVTGLDRVDATLTAPQGYQPVQLQTGQDDYHCFLLDPQNASPSSITTQKFVTGFNVAPGTPTMVHHVLLYAVDRASAQQADTTGTGWTCFGGPNVGSSSSTNVLAAWAPGSPATLYPAGTGIALKSSDVVVMQIHYNFANAPVPVPFDQTSVQLKLENNIDFTHQAQLLPVIDNKFTIPPTTASFTDEDTKPAAFGGVGLRVWGLLPHMHQLGTEIKVILDEGTANEQCLIDIPAWNFNWQQSYFFADGPGFIQTQGGDQATVRCTWDNPTANSITFGENTSDEMCLAFAYATL